MSGGGDGGTASEGQVYMYVRPPFIGRIANFYSRLYVKFSKIERNIYLIFYTFNAKRL